MQESHDSYLRTQLTTAIHGAAQSPTFETAQLKRNSHSGYLPARPKDADIQIARYLRGKQRPQGIRVDTLAANALYSPCHDSHEARVVEVYPGKFDDALRGKLHHVYLDFEYQSEATHSYTLTYTPHTRFALSTKDGQPIHYTALSYVWGHPVFDCTISLQGGDKAITKSLHTAIRHLRHSTESVVLWIDQIAINQDDPRDKAHQIQLMSFVYRRAFNTVIWLGKEPDNGAFAALESLHLATYGRSDGDLGVTAGDDAGLASATEITSLRQLLERPWFERTWTIQEAILSLEPYFMTGSSTVHWEDFAGHCVSIADRGIVSNDAHTGTATALHTTSGVNVAAELWAMRSFFQSIPSKNLLLDALVETRYAKVSNPLDKVYGVLGLCQTQDIVPDYSISSHVLFRQVALKILGRVLDRLAASSDASLPGLGPLHHDLFRMFSCIDHESKSRDGLQSWAPDWTRPRVTTSLGFSGQVWYRAGAGKLVHDVLRVNSDQRSLTVSTVMCGKITHLAPVITDARLNPSADLESNAGLRACIAFASTSPSPVSFASFCHTLVAGREDSGNGLFNAKHVDQYIEVLSLLCDTLSRRHPTFPDQMYSKRQKGGHLTLENLKSRSTGRAFQSLKKVFSIALLNRRLCLLDGGRLALVPRYARVGDVVAVFPGSNVPFVLRPASQNGDRFELVGECYVHDLMEGEALADCSRKPEPVVLV